jgi:hypothetical protein
MSNAVADDIISVFQAEACARVEAERAQMQTHGFDPGESVAEWLTRLRREGEARRNN